MFLNADLLVVLLMMLQQRTIMTICVSSMRKQNVGRQNSTRRGANTKRSKRPQMIKELKRLESVVHILRSLRKRLL